MAHLVTIINAMKLILIQTSPNTQYAQIYALPNVTIAKRYRTLYQCVVNIQTVYTLGNRVKIILPPMQTVDVQINVSQDV